MLAIQSTGQELIDVPDPAAFLAENHVGFVVNTESLRQIEGHFNPLQYDPVKVAWVQHDGGRALRIIDGFTRTQFLAKHGETIRQTHAGFRFAAIDVTEGLLRNPTIAEADANQRDVLTPVEYLRALIPPTIVHAEIAPKRLAAYIVTSWADMVGGRIARQYSALAAIWYLEGRGFQPGKVPGQFFVGESAADHAAVERALDQISDTIPPRIRMTRLSSARLGPAAFGLIGAQDQAIGGPDSALQQIYGLLFTPELTASIERESRSNRGISTEELRAKLAYLVLPQSRSDNYSVLRRILQDPQLTYQDRSGLLAHRDPRNAYVRWQQKNGMPQEVRKVSTSDPPIVTAPPLQRHTENTVKGVLPPSVEPLPSDPVLPVADPYAGWLTRFEFAAAHNITGTTVSEWCANGWIPGAVKVMRRNKSGAMIPMWLIPPDSQPLHSTPEQKAAHRIVEAACSRIIQQVPLLVEGQLDAELRAQIDETIKVLGQLRYGVPDLPGQVEKYAQLNEKYTHLLEQYTARGA